MINTKTFIKDLQTYYDNKAKYNLSVDHADNNIHNNTFLNLSSMEKCLNSTKGGIVTKVREPIYLNSIYYNGIYRVQVVFKVEPNITNEIMKRFTNLFDNCSCGIIGMHFICETPENYVECLKWITEQHFEWANPMKRGKNWIKSENNCWCLEINNSLHAQKVLSVMPECEFQPYQCLENLNSY